MIMNDYYWMEFGGTATVRPDIFATSEREIRAEPPKADSPIMVGLLDKCAMPSVNETFA